MKHRILAASLSLALGVGALEAPAARAAETASAEESERAKMLFSSGAQAYASGQFSAAIQAFTEANRILPRPAIVYSLAQAHRRQYFIARKPENLRGAVASFHAYIDQVPDGGRRADAAQALSELEPMLAHLGPEAAAPTVGPSEPPKEPPRLMITTQPSGATFTIDGRERRQTPYAAEVTPGKHRVRVSLEGYFDEEREVLAVDRTLVPVPVELRERPAHLVVHAPSGCDIWLDGRVIGTAPLPDAIDLPSGSHLIAVTKNGYKAYSQDIEFRHDERRTLDVHLEATGQRIVARSLLISGGALVVAGGVLSFLALNRQNAAQDVRDEQTHRPATPSDESDYRDARDARDRWRTGAILAFSAGGAALVTGLVFHVFDRPTVVAPRLRPEDRKPRPANPLEPVEMSLAPFVGPSFGGATISGKF